VNKNILSDNYIIRRPSTE